MLASRLFSRRCITRSPVQTISFTCHMAATPISPVELRGISATVHSPGNSRSISTTMTKMEGLFNCEVTNFKSGALGETHPGLRLLVSKPANLEPGKRYPVIYVLDGNEYFGAAADTTRMYTLYGQGFPSAFVVGIGYDVDTSGEAATRRTPALTPPMRSAGELEDLMWANGASGGGAEVTGNAPNFLKAIIEEVKPMVEELYPIDAKDCTLFGHSLGGLFASWVLLTSTSTFQRYIIASPAQYFDKQVALEWEKEYAEKNDDLAAKVYVTYGEIENAAHWKALMAGAIAVTPPGPMLDYCKGFVSHCDKFGWPTIGESTAAFTEQLRGREYKSLELSSEVMNGHGHLVVPICLAKGLQKVFGWKEPF